MNGDLLKHLWESDAASALTNQAAREIERLREENQQLVASVERLRSALEPFAVGGAASCIDRQDYSVMRERLKDWTGVSDWKLAVSTYDETPPAALAEVKAQALENPTITQNVNNP